jgi:riboflavin kinase/FMN adenylyltransferase
MFGGIVIHGDGKGKLLGYPTANLDVSIKETKLREGVYAAKATIFGKTYLAALILLAIKGKEKVEVHVIGYDHGDFYGAYLQVEAFQKISEIEWMETDAELRQKIRTDLETIQDVLTLEE